MRESEYDEFLSSQRRLSEQYNLTGGLPEGYFPTVINAWTEEGGVVAVSVKPEVAPSFGLEVVFKYNGRFGDLTDEEQWGLTSFISGLPVHFQESMVALQAHLAALDEAEDADFSDIKPEDITG